MKDPWVSSQNKGTLPTISAWGNYKLLELTSIICFSLHYSGLLQLMNLED